jgi:hypothetical protein
MKIGSTTEVQEKRKEKKKNCAGSENHSPH